MSNLLHESGDESDVENSNDEEEDIEDDRRSHNLILIRM